MSVLQIGFQAASLATHNHVHTVCVSGVMAPSIESCFPHVFGVFVVLYIFVQCNVWCSHREVGAYFGRRV